MKKNRAKEILQEALRETKLVRVSYKRSDDEDYITMVSTSKVKEALEELTRCEKEEQEKTQLK